MKIACLQLRNHRSLVTGQHLGDHLAGVRVEAEAARHGVGGAPVVARDHEQAQALRRATAASASRAPALGSSPNASSASGVQAVAFAGLAGQQRHRGALGLLLLHRAPPAGPG